jgi:hypothetical protein
LSRYQVQLIIDGVVIPTTTTVSTIEETGDLTIPKAIRYKGDKQMQYDIQVLYGKGYTTLANQLEAIIEKAPEIEDEVVNLTTVILDEVNELENAKDYAYDCGRDEGYSEGYGDGEWDHMHDYDEGFDDGKSEGYEEGYAEGLEAGLES